MAAVGFGEALKATTGAKLTVSYVEATGSFSAVEHPPTLKSKPRLSNAGIILAWLIVPFAKQLSTVRPESIIRTSYWPDGVNLINVIIPVITDADPILIYFYRVTLVKYIRYIRT